MGFQVQGIELEKSLLFPLLDALLQEIFNEFQMTFRTCRSYSFLTVPAIQTILTRAKTFHRMEIMVTISTLLKADVTSFYLNDLEVVLFVNTQCLYALIRKFKETAQTFVTFFLRRASRRFGVTLILPTLRTLPDFNLFDFTCSEGWCHTMPMIGIITNLTENKLMQVRVIYFTHSTQFLVLMLS